MNWQKIRTLILIFFTVVLCLQLPVTLYVNDKLTLDFISMARAFQLVLAFSFIFASIKFSKINFLNIFLIVSILIQLIATIKYEPANELVAYNFIAILVLISAITFKEDLKHWLVFNFPVHLTALVLPIFFKAPSLHTTLSQLVSNFLFGIFSLVVSLFVVAIYSTQEYFSKKLALELQDQEKRLNDEFDKIQKMKVQLEIGNLASQVAHDIRSPLSALENISSIHLFDSQEGHIARESIKRIKGIANALLEKGRVVQPRNLSDHELNLLLKIGIETKRIEFPTRKINLILTNQKIRISIDDVQFESILSNLINNALESSDVESEVTISTEIINSSSVVISIIDNGKGIDSELLSKLGHEKISMNKKDGNGLGIYSAFHIVKSWGGEFEIKSNLNHGTTIFITLPLVDLTNKYGAYILLDDDELVRVTWESRAKKTGINLITYSNPYDFLGSVDKFPKNSIFYIDSELGSEKGEDVARKIFELGYINICMCSGYSEEKFAHLKFIQKTINKSPPF